MKIFKYELFPGQTSVSLHKGAKILTVQVQFEQVNMWALVNPLEELETRTFDIYPTGYDISGNPGNYIATFQLNGGGLVFHVFEKDSDESKMQMRN